MISEIENRLGLIYNRKRGTVFIQQGDRYIFFCAKSLSLIDILTTDYKIATSFFSNFSNNWNISAIRNSDTYDTILLTIYFSNKCNLKCKYCYLHGDFSLSKSSIEEISDNLFIENEITNIVNSNCKKIEINFFGGEPLLFKDRILDIIEVIKRNLHSNVDIKLSLTTNGTLLSPILIDKFQNLGVDILLSLDSPPENHDAYRAGNEKIYSFKNILKNIKGFEHRVSVVTTITQKTESIKNALSILMDYGFKNVGFNLVHTLNPLLCIRKEDSTRFINELIENENWFIDNSDIIMNIKRLKKQIIFRKLKFSPCNSGINSYAITSAGIKYFCHSCVGDHNYQLNDFIPGNYIINNPVVNLSELGECINCWAYHLCGGECWIILRDYTIEQRKLRCDIIKTLIRIALICNYVR